MNRISFKGSHAVVWNIVSLIFGSGTAPLDEPGRGGRSGTPDSTEPSRKPGRMRRGRQRPVTSAAVPVDPDCLDVLFDFLVACGVPEAKRDRLAGERAERLALLAKDVETLRRYRRDGTITDVRIVDEWPF